MTNRKIIDERRKTYEKRKEDIGKLREGIKKLKEQGWNNKRIAKALNCSENTVRSISK